MTNEARLQLLKRVEERTDVLLERTAESIEEALQLYLAQEQLTLRPKRPPPEASS